MKWTLARDQVDKISLYRLLLLVLTSLMAWAWIILITILILVIETRLGGVLELEVNLEMKKVVGEEEEIEHLKDE